jgi:hypothetical protein
MIRILSMVIVLVLASVAAHACPVCFDAKGGTLNAFRFSAFFLSAIPLLGFVAFYFWIRNKTKDSDS